MTEGLNNWNTGDDIVLEIFIADAATGLGLTGQDGYTEVTIQRDSNSEWWTGSTWSATRTVFAPTEEDSSNQPGRYTYTFPGSTGNTHADRYVAHVKVDNPPTAEGSAYEVHVSRDHIWDAYQAVHATIGTFGEFVNIDTSIVVDAVLDEATSGHTVSGSVGKALIDAYGLTSAQVLSIADAVWDEAKSEHTNATTFGDLTNKIDQSLSDTESNIRGEDSDTLETLSDQIDGTAVPADVKIYESEPSIR